MRTRGYHVIFFLIEHPCSRKEPRCVVPPFRVDLLTYGRTNNETRGIYTIDEISRPYRIPSLSSYLKQ